MPDPSHAEPRKLENLADSEDILKECSSIEMELAALKSRYEQYFVGAERSRPSVAHAMLRKRLDNLRATFNRTTAVQFRVKNVTNRFLTYERLWNRTLLDMENGTYRRDLFKARLHAEKRKRKENDERSQANPPDSLAQDLSEPKLRAIFEAYVNAKKRCSEDVSKLSFDSVASRLRKQVPELMKTHRAHSVEFKIVIKDGKAVLKVVPKSQSKPPQ